MRRERVWRLAAWTVLVCAVGLACMIERDRLLKLADPSRYAGDGLELALAALPAGFLVGAITALALPGARGTPFDVARRTGGGRGWRAAVYAVAGLVTCSALVSCGGASPYATLGTQEFPFAMIVTGLVGAGAGAVSGARAHLRLKRIGRSVDRIMLRQSTRLLPVESRQRWLEEWQVEQSQIPTSLGRLVFSLSLLACMPRMGLTLRLPARRRGRG